MKFLEIPELDVLSRALSLSNPTIKVNARVEAYSCKAVARERKLFKALESELIQDISHSTSVSPPEHHQGLLDSAFGPLDKRESRKTLWMLIGLLNVAFPDYDFSKVRPEDFRREEGPRAVLSSLSSALDHMRSPSGQRSFSALPPSGSFAFPSSPYSEPMSLPGASSSPQDGEVPTNPFLRQVLDPIIDLAECEVYSYTPDVDSDPHAVDSDDESEDDGGDPDAFEGDDDGMAWEMEGLEGMSGYRNSSNHPNAGTIGNHSSTRGGGAAGRGGSGHSTTPWFARPATPMKSFASIFGGGASAPATPASTADSDDYFGDSTGGLLWSTFHFLYNRKAKRIVFITAWARTPTDPNRARRRAPRASSRRIAMRRSQSRGSTARASTLGAGASEESDLGSGDDDDDDGEGEGRDENVAPINALVSSGLTSSAINTVNQRTGPSGVRAPPQVVRAKAANAAAAAAASPGARMKRTASTTSISRSKSVAKKSKAAVASG
ncbi:hypothetical protein OIV83_002644 [Microbotryomycetes sp. JL201]|nr:hypothetical protein OIV83_002644 [Microbotryomycetes sp. JL201]